MKREPAKSDIALRIEQRLKLLKMSASAASLKAGLSRYAISNIQKNPKSIPRGKTLMRLADALETTPEYLLKGDSGPSTNSASLNIPLVTWVSAGAMARDDLQQDIISEIRVVGLDPRGKWIALRVDGDSMDRISPPGSVIFVNLKDQRLVTNACYVITNGDGEATYKRFRSNPPRFEPVSTNPIHEPIFPDGEPSVIGRVKKTTLDM